MHYPKNYLQNLGGQMQIHSFNIGENLNNKFKFDDLWDTDSSCEELRYTSVIEDNHKNSLQSNRVELNQTEFQETVSSPEKTSIEPPSNVSPMNQPILQDQFLLNTNASLVAYQQESVIDPSNGDIEVALELNSENFKEVKNFDAVESVPSNAPYFSPTQLFFENFQEPLGVDKILVEKYNYRWIDNKAISPTQSLEPTSEEPSFNLSNDPIAELKEEFEALAQIHSDLISTYENLLNTNLDIVSELNKAKSEILVLQNEITDMKSTMFSREDLDFAIRTALEPVEKELREYTIQFNPQSIIDSEISGVDAKNREFNLQNLFYDEFYDVKWETGSEARILYWKMAYENFSWRGKNFYPEHHTEAFTENVSRAFEIWDDGLNSLIFVESPTNGSADVTVLVSEFELDATETARWHYAYNDAEILDAVIEIDIETLSSPYLMTTILHEIGNVLGLGDIQRNDQIFSVMEEPIIQSFSGDILWQDDLNLIRQVYGENLSENVFTDATPHSDVDLAYAIINATDPLKERIEFLETQLELEREFAQNNADVDLTMQNAVLEFEKARDITNAENEILKMQLEETRLELDYANVLRQELQLSKVEQEIRLTPEVRFAYEEDSFVSPNLMEKENVIYVGDISNPNDNDIYFIHSDKSELKINFTSLEDEKLHQFQILDVSGNIYTRQLIDGDANVSVSLPMQENYFLHINSANDFSDYAVWYA